MSTKCKKLSFNYDNRYVIALNTLRDYIKELHGIDIQDVCGRESPEAVQEKLKIDELYLPTEDEDLKLKWLLETLEVNKKYPNRDIIDYLQAKQGFSVANGINTFKLKYDETTFSWAIEVIKLIESVVRNEEAYNQEDQTLTLLVGG